MTTLSEAKMPSLADKIEAQTKKPESKAKKVVKKVLGAVKRKK